MSEKACSQSSGEKMPDGQYMGMARSGDPGRKGSDKKEACSKCCEAVMQPGPFLAILGNSSNLYLNKEFSISGHKLRLNANFCLDPY